MRKRASRRRGHSWVGWFTRSANPWRSTPLRCTLAQCSRSSRKYCTSLDLTMSTKRCPARCMSQNTLTARTGRSGARCSSGLLSAEGITHASAACMSTWGCFAAMLSRSWSISGSRRSLPCML